jgi:hypothetical protein
MDAREQTKELLAQLNNTISEIEAEGYNSPSVDASLRSLGAMREDLEKQLQDTSA